MHGVGGGGAVSSLSYGTYWFWTCTGHCPMSSRVVFIFFSYQGPLPCTISLTAYELGSFSSPPETPQITPPGSANVLSGDVSQVTSNHSTEIDMDREHVFIFSRPSKYSSACWKDAAMVDFWSHRNLGLSTHEWQRGGPSRPQTPVVKLQG